MEDGFKAAWEASPWFNRFHGDLTLEDRLHHEMMNVVRSLPDEAHIRLFLSEPRAMQTYVELLDEYVRRLGAAAYYDVTQESSSWMARPTWIFVRPQPLDTEPVSSWTLPGWSSHRSIDPSVLKSEKFSEPPIRGSRIWTRREAIARLAIRSSPARIGALGYFECGYVRDPDAASLLDNTIEAMMLTWRLQRPTDVPNPLEPLLDLVRHPFRPYVGIVRTGGNVPLGHTILQVSCLGIKEES